MQKKKNEYHRYKELWSIKNLDHHNSLPKTTRVHRNLSKNLNKEQTTIKKKNPKNRTSNKNPFRSNYKAYRKRIKFSGSRSIFCGAISFGQWRQWLDVGIQWLQNCRMPFCLLWQNYCQRHYVSEPISSCNLFYFITLVRIFYFSDMYVFFFRVISDGLPISFTIRSFIILKSLVVRFSSLIPVTTVV